MYQEIEVIDCPTTEPDTDRTLTGHHSPLTAKALVQHGGNKVTIK